MTVVDIATGEIINRAPAVHTPAPMTEVDVAAQCRTIETWATRCDSIDELREADQRAATRIVAAVATLTRFAGTDRRAEVLALLPVETVDVLEAITATLTVATQEQAS